MCLTTIDNGKQNMAINTITPTLPSTSIEHGEYATQKWYLQLP